MLLFLDQRLDTYMKGQRIISGFFLLFIFLRQLQLRH